MELFLHQIFSGLATGAIYAAVALAVVMIFLAIDHFNFAQGEMAMFSTFICWALIDAGLPYWVGVLVVGAVITLNVALGGMKGITLVQAVQYWIKMFAISVPIFVLLSVYGGYGKNLSLNKSISDSPPAIVQTVDPGQTERVLPAKAPKDEDWIAPFGPLTTKAAKAAGLTPEE